jgi:TPR repeat protein
MKKSIYHAEQAAIAGHPKARYNLGVNEAKYCGRYDRAVNHFIIAASVGCQHSLKTLEDLYGEGYASKEDYDSALRAYQAAVDEMKSPEREEVEAHCKTTTEG